MWKRFAASTLLRIIRSELLVSSDSINPLLASAYDMQRGRLAPEDFRQRLDTFYRDADLEDLQRGVGLERKREVLVTPDAYKVDVQDWRNDGQKRSAWKARLWKRRFAYLRHMGVRCDLLVLRSGEQVPPHGHYRVISGFYVLEGRVAFQHYHRIRDEPSGLLVRRTVDAICGPGGYSTNSEFHDNIHWLAGLDEKSFLFRFTVTGVPGPTFAPPKSDHAERAYVDPTGQPDPDGLILAPYIDDTAAKKLVMIHAAVPHNHLATP